MLVTSQIGRLLLWHVLRYVARHPLLTLLNTLSVALGVAVFMAIQIANSSASHAFAASIDVVAGKTHVEVVSRDDRLDETILPVLAGLPSVSAATPLLQAVLTLPDSPGEYLEVLGIDIFSNSPFATFRLEDSQASSLDPERWLAKPGAVAVTETFARERRLSVGDKIKVLANGAIQELEIVSLMRLNEAPPGAHSRFAAMDIGWMQELLGRAGHLSSVQLRVQDPNQIGKALAEIQAVIPPSALASPPSQRNLQVQKMLSGFQLNLSALSMISLLVGMFLIYNTIAASVVRRRQETGILRSLGASQCEICILFVGEALLFGLLGAGLGIAAGFALAHSLVHHVAATISSLYVLVEINKLSVSPLLICLSAFFGIFSVLAAALWPAWEGATMNTVETLHPGHTQETMLHRSPSYLLASLLSFLLAGLSAVGALNIAPWLGFACAFFVLLGFAWLLPSLTLLFSGAVAAVRRNVPVIVTLAAQNLIRSLHRSAVTAAALMASIAMLVGVSVMVYSFRVTVDLWVDHSVQADLFLAPASNQTLGPVDFVPQQVIETIRERPDILSVETFRELEISFRGEVAFLDVIEGNRNRQFRFKGGNDPGKRAQFEKPGNVAVNESLANKFKIRDGDTILLPAPSGMLPFRVAGIYYDYTHDQGAFSMSRANFEPIWRDPRVNSLAIYLHDPQKLSAIEADLRQRYSSGGEMLLYSNRSLRERIFRIFDQTFSVTYVLRTISLAVAALGIFLTFTILVAERDRELGMLRAVGASRSQIQSLILCESGMIGLLACASGICAGLLLAVVLTEVINKAFFGWSIQFWIPWTQILLTPAWIIPAALAAGWMPAWRAGHASIAGVLRSE